MRWRLGLSPALALIAVLAVGLAAIKAATPATTGVSWTLFLVVLLAGTLGLIVRRDRGAWLGFAMFGWAYLLVGAISPLQTALAARLPDDASIDWLIIDRVHPSPPRSSPFAFKVARRGERFYKMKGSTYDTPFMPTPQEIDSFDANEARMVETRYRRGRARWTCYAFAGLAFALCGAMLGRALEISRRPDHDPGSRGEGDPT